MFRAVSIFLSALLFLIAAPAKAQNIPSGAIVLLTSQQSGRQLSADVPQKILLSPNGSGWEQWRFVSDSGGYHLESFHGTSLIGEWSGEAYHAPVRPIEGLRIQPADPSVSGLPQGKVIITYSEAGSTSRRYLMETPAGTVTWGSAQQVYKNGAWTDVIAQNLQWAMTVVASPSGGRQAKRLAIDEGYQPRVVSVHNTRIYWTPSGAPTLIPSNSTTESNPTMGLSVNNRPLVFGQTVTFVRDTRDSMNHLYWYIVPNGTFSGPLEGLRSDTSPSYSLYTIVPVPPYQNGNRVPSGLNVVYLRNQARGSNLSASPEGKLNLSPSTGAWEQWALTLH